MSEITSAPAVAPAGCLLRMFWILGGNAGIYLALATIAATGAPLPSYLDGIVVALLALTLAARRVDIVRCGGLRFDAEPATLADWWRWSGLLALATAGAWALAHAVAGSLG